MTLSRFIQGVSVSAAQTTELTEPTGLLRARLARTAWRLLDD
ncbi:hypothetical protein ACLMAL_24375 [Nocardia sp. CWNU-33]